MINLVNGNGQIGNFLKKKIDSVNIDKPVFIYHTWNIDNKSDEVQKKEYQKFKEFVDKNKDNRIIFISTKSQKESQYVKYKQLSESYLIENCSDCLVLKFPTLIGKGVFHDFKNGTKQPYGIMEIMTLEEASENILQNINYSGILKTLYFNGHTIKADIVYNLVNV